MNKRKNILIAIAIPAAFILPAALTGCGTNHTPAAIKAPGTPATPSVPSETDYINWATQVAPDINTLKTAAEHLAASSSPSDCAPALRAIQALAQDPLPPIDPTDWTALVNDTTTAMAYCVSGNVGAMAPYVAKITADGAAFRHARDAAYPDLATGNGMI